MLKIQNLSVTVAGKNIIKNLSLEIKPGEIHAIMGPNGSGKSTLSNTLMGNPKYQVTDGEILIDGENIALLSPDKRARKGLFLAFQYPEELPGVSLTSFLKTAYTAMQKERGEEPMSIIEFRKVLRTLLKEFSLDSAFLNREVNEGFSGGEKKKVEILQMALLKPKYAILDETDSGLDVDALKIVADGIGQLTGKERGILLITHYQRILHYVKPHFVHVMINGKIVESGGHELSEKLEKEGYAWLREKYGIPVEAEDLKPVPLAA